MQNKFLVVQSIDEDVLSYIECVVVLEAWMVFSQTKCDSELKPFFLKLSRMILYNKSYIT